MKVNILRAEFTIQANCPKQTDYFSRQLTLKAQKESQQSHK